VGPKASMGVSLCNAVTLGFFFSHSLLSLNISLNLFRVNFGLASCGSSGGSQRQDCRSGLRELHGDCLGGLPRVN
jgi:hypothetical protein